MCYNIAQRGILGSIAKGSADSSISSVDLDRGSYEEDNVEYSSPMRPYQDEPLAGEETGHA